MQGGTNRVDLKNISVEKKECACATATKERPVRTQLAKGLLRAIREYVGSAQPGEHVAHRPELPQILVSDAMKARASDIHIEPCDGSVRIRFRIDGILADVASVSAEQRWRRCRAW